MPDMPSYWIGYREALGRVRDAIQTDSEKVENRAVELEDNWGLEHHATAEAYGEIEAFSRATEMVDAALRDAP